MLGNKVEITILMLFSPSYLHLFVIITNTSKLFMFLTAVTSELVCISFISAVNLWYGQQVLLKR